MTTSSPVHHAPEELLVEYAVGACAASAALSVACHLSFCGACSARTRELEAVGGALLEAVTPEPMAPGALERLFIRIEGLPAGAGSGREPTVSPAAERLLLPAGVPRLVLPYLADAAASKWRRLAPGVRRVDLQVGPPPTVARLVALQPGVEIPFHDHGGTEYTVIFSGALTDERGRFARGDLSVREAGERHVQRVERRELCVALVINEGPLVPLTWKGRVLKLISGA